MQSKELTALRFHALKDFNWASSFSISPSGACHQSVPTAKAIDQLPAGEMKALKHMGVLRLVNSVQKPQVKRQRRGTPPDNSSGVKPVPG